MKDTRKALLAIQSSFQYSAWYGFAVRGRDVAQSNIRQLLEMPVSDIPELQSVNPIFSNQEQGGFP